MPPSTTNTQDQYNTSQIQAPPQASVE
jgi:hypothetical protein